MRPCISKWQPCWSVRRNTVKVVVDANLCEGNARCVNAAPAVFRLEDDDQATVLIEHPGGDLRPAVERAVRLCPRQAIRIEEND